MTLDLYGRTVPSTLHQKVKFMVEEQLISVAIEEDIIATLTTFNPYTEVDENVMECSFQSLEVVNATFVEEGKKIPTPRKIEILKSLQNGNQANLWQKSMTGLGLGKFLQGTSKAVSTVMK